MSETDGQVEGVGTFKSEPGRQHTVEITSLQTATCSVYTAPAAGDPMTFDVTTAPATGTRDPFAFGSGSRHGIDSGERHLAGLNEYTTRRIMPIATSRGVAFMHVTGDLINGDNTSPVVEEAQDNNWKRALTSYCDAPAAPCRDGQRRSGRPSVR